MAGSELSEDCKKKLRHIDDLLVEMLDQTKDPEADVRVLRNTVNRILAAVASAATDTDEECKKALREIDSQIGAVTSRQSFELLGRNLAELQEFLHSLLNLVRTLLADSD